MTKHAFVCQSCRTPVPYPGDRIEKRLEYIRADRRGRLRVLTIGWFCRPCAEVDVDVEERRADGSIAASGVEQLSMLEEES